MAMAAEVVELIDFEHVVDSPDFANASRSDPDGEIWNSDPIPWNGWSVVVLLAISGILGNALVLMVLLRPRHKRSSTDTLIANLALADLMTCLAVTPLPIAHAVNIVPESLAGYIFCTFVHIPFFLLLSTVASILTLMTISIERFVAVVHPYTFDRAFTPKKTLTIIGTIWAFSIVLNIYHFLIITPKDGECIVMFPSETVQVVLGVAIFFCRYCFPTTVMVVCHILTIRELLRKNKHIVRSSWCRSSRRTRLVRVRRRVVATLFAIIIVFIVCWTPDQLFFLFCNLGVIKRSYIFGETHRNLLLLGFITSISNIIIYAAMNPKFRQALRNMFQGFGEACHHGICYQIYEHVTRKGA